MAKTVINSTKRYSLADKYLLKILSQSKIDFKTKRSNIRKMNLINENQQDFNYIIHDESNKEVEYSS